MSIFFPNRKRQLTFLQRLRFAWVAFRNADRAFYGIPVRVDYDIPAGMRPSQFDEIVGASVKLTTVDYDGTKTRGL